MGHAEWGMGNGGWRLAAGATQPDGVNRAADGTTPHSEFAIHNSPLRQAQGVALTISLLPLCALLAMVGYFGPWVPHRAAGLVITGLDLGEQVKFLYPVQQGDISLWREGFYLPLVAVSAAMSLYAWRAEMGYRLPVRLGLLLLAGVAALNLLPPAWTPGLLLSPEFRLQTGLMLVCLTLILLAPLVSLLPIRLMGATVVLLVVAALYFPLAQFQWILPALADLYGHALVPGWGPWVMGIGLAGIAYCVLHIAFVGHNQGKAKL